jgi:hypothetical protein
VPLYTTIAYKQNQEGYKTSILCKLGYWNRNDKGKIEKAEMKFLKFCWLYAVQDAISDFTVRSELQKGKGVGRRTEKWGDRLLQRGRA